MSDDKGNEYDQFADWIGWEGGVMSLALHGVDEVDVPEGLKEVWSDVMRIASEYEKLQHKVYRILDERSVTTNG